MTRAVMLAFLLLSPSTAGHGALPGGIPMVHAGRVAASPSWTAPARLVPVVTAAAGSSGCPAWILARVIRAESGWRSGAVGVNDDGSRDLGIAQLGERWLAEFAALDNAGLPFDPFDPVQAIPVAARYLARLHRSTGDWRAAVAAYNCGLSKVRSGAVPARTAAYVRSVFGEEE